jgi:hypothetical protein
VAHRFHVACGLPVTISHIQSILGE